MKRFALLIFAILSLSVVAVCQCEFCGPWHGNLNILGRKLPIVINIDHVGDSVMKAWLFGSCSRGEESIDSDIDLLVDYDYDAGASLMTVSGIRIGLKKLLSREVDIVENGCLLPFAAPSAQRDKILIYEREATRLRTSSTYP